LWHKQLSHLNEKDMKLLMQQILIKGMSLKNNKEKLPLLKECVQEATL
jgi:hypothetical protein